MSAPHPDLSKLQFRQREHDCSLSGPNSVVAHPLLLAGTMAASSGEDIPAQLAALLGREVVNIRKTSETPPRISVIDVVEAITGQAKNNAGKTLELIKESHPEVYPN